MGRRFSWLGMALIALGPWVPSACSGAGHTFGTASGGEAGLGGQGTGGLATEGRSSAQIGGAGVGGGRASGGSTSGDSSIVGGSTDGGEATGGSSNGGETSGGGLGGSAKGGTGGSNGGTGGSTKGGTGGGGTSSGGSGGSGGACAQTLCNGVCVNLSTSKANCGSCGHSCRYSASSCSASKCSPIVLASASGPTQLAQDNNYIYWLDDVDDTIKRAAKDASTPSASPEFVAGTISKPSAIAISGTTLLEWARLPPDSTSPGELMYLPINPAGAPKSSGISFMAYVNEMTVVGGTIYFTYSALSGPGAIMWAYPSGGATTTLCGPGTACTTQDPIGIAADASNVYFTDIWTGPGGGRVMKLPISGGAGTPLVSNANFPSHLAVSGATVYYQSNSDLMRVSTDGLTLGTVASAGTAGGGIAADTSGVYWVDNTSGVYKLPTGATTAVPVATGQGAPSYIALDAGSIYWTNHSSGTVMAVAK